MADYLLIINPGSTSTRVALFDGDRKVNDDMLRHDRSELVKYDNVADQFDFRMEGVNRWIDSLGIDSSDFKAVVGRGAPLRPLDGGSYAITEEMLSDLREKRYSNHASNLGAIIAHHLSQRFGVPSLIADPVTVDNFIDEARISGVPEIERKCRAHTLNIREVCRRQALSAGKTLEEVSFIAVHMGGGISVAAVEGGRIIDVNDALLGMGPFSPERAGALPIGSLVKLCYSGKYTEEEMVAKLSKESGLVAYTGYASLKDVEDLINKGDKEALKYFDAMAYQIAKEIGAIAVVLKGRFEAIVMTGGMAHSRRLIDEISKRVSFLGRIAVVPGEFEMEALAAAGMRYLRREETLKKY
jgi:butyrate kinase